MKKYSPKGYVSEIIPCHNSRKLSIEDRMLNKLNLFAQTNPIYFNEIDLIVDGIICKSYEGDINDYWLSSKKYDTSYQPFYPTWILSAYALALEAKKMGFTELVDVGSGDGRIAYCGAALGLESFSIEIDMDLTLLQHKLSRLTNIHYEILNADATTFEYNSLKLSHPIFFISGLPELGDVLAKTVIKKVREIRNLNCSIGFNFMGSHKMRDYTQDRTKWGWGNIIDLFQLEVLSCITLPTLWTNDQEIGTAYVYTQSHSQFNSL
jgi:hypothetical protein